MFRTATTACAAILLASCGPGPETDTGEAGAEKPMVPRPALPVAEAPLDREALLVEALRAASAAAVGENDAARQRELGDKRFSLRLRFGCAGTDAAEDELRRWTFDEEKRVLRVSVQPGIDSDDPVVESLGGESFESVEGFWIRRPWVLKAACAAAAHSAPAASPEATSAGKNAQAAEATAAGGAERQAQDDVGGGVAPVAMRVGLAQFLTETDARTHRRHSRAYEAVTTIAEGSTPSAVGYDLVISGRLRQLPDGRVIACELSKPTEPPACIFSTRFEQVELVRPDTGETLAKWSSR